MSNNEYQNQRLVLQLFKNNQIYTIFFVFLYMLAFYLQPWLVAEIAPAPVLADTAGLLSELINKGLGNAIWLRQILFGLLLLLQAILLNSIAQEHRLAKRPTYITAISYILIIFLFKIDNDLSPSFLANTFLLFSLTSLYQTYEKNASMGNVFNAGLGIGLATMCYYSSSVYLLWVLLGSFVLRSFEWKEGLILLMGFLVPFIWVGVYEFWIDNFENWWRLDILANYGFNWQISLTPWTIAGIVSGGLLLLWSMLNWQNIHYKTTMREQKSIQLIFLMLLLGLLTFFAQNTLYIEHFMVLAVPMALLLSLNLHTIQSNGLAELVHLLLFMGCLAVQYYV